MKVIVELQDRYDREYAMKLGDWNGRWKGKEKVVWGYENGY